MPKGVTLGALALTWGTQGVPGGAILDPNGTKLGPRWCQSGPKRLRKGVISGPRGPPESIFRRVARKRVMCAKPTFFLSKTTNSAGPGRVLLVNFLVKSPPWRPTSSKSRAKTAKMHQDGSQNAGVHPGGNSVRTQWDPTGKQFPRGARSGGAARPWRRGQRGVGG